ncbi:hypothetical protein V5O48_013354, partial [Marasmius crinis-equi]
MSTFPRIQDSYMRSTSLESPLFSHSQATDSPITPQFSNQHWLSTFRQGLDGIDELDQELNDEEVDNGEKSPGGYEQQREHSSSSQELAVPPTSSSPPTSMLDSDFSVNIHTDYSPETSICDSLCFSDALEPPPDNEGEVDIVFLAQLQERLATVARHRDRERKQQEPMYGHVSFRVEDDSSAPAASYVAYGHLRPVLQDLDAYSHLSSNIFRSANKKRTRSMVSHTSDDHFQGQHLSVPSNAKRARTSFTSNSSVKRSFSRSRNSRSSANGSGEEKENEGFASTTATMRRALSLRSQDALKIGLLGTPSNVEKKTDEGEDAVEKACKVLPADWVPTVPCSPIPAKPLRRLPLARQPLRASHDAVKGKVAKMTIDAHTDTDSDNESEIEFGRAKPSSKRSVLAVPIIAPPIDHVPEFPLSKEGRAKKRVEGFRKRESDLRVADELAGFTDDGTLLSWTAFGVDREFGEEMVAWILGVLPFQPPSPSSRSRSLSNAPSPGPLTTTTSDSSTSSMDSFRCSPNFSSSSSSLASIPVRVLHDVKTPYGRGIDNLVHQLRTSPETRFMGVYFFMRFLWCLSIKPENHGQVKKEVEKRSSSTAGGKGASQSREVPSPLAEALGVDEERFTDTMWDVVVACMALSVKMHRDFLPPLFPVYSQVFEETAPHEPGGLGYEQLESAQRLVLFALQYNMGGSPQAVLDELWECGVMRDLLMYAGYGPVCTGEKELLRWWGAVQRETWILLFRAVMDPRVLRYPLSVVTGCAVMVGMEKVLVNERYAAEVDWWCELEFRVQRASRKDGSEAGKEERRRRKEAKKECEGWGEDVKELLGIAEENMAGWLGPDTSPPPPDKIVSAALNFSLTKLLIATWFNLLVYTFELNLGLYFLKISSRKSSRAVVMIGLALETAATLLVCIHGYN